MTKHDQLQAKANAATNTSGTGSEHVPPTPRPLPALLPSCPQLPPPAAEKMDAPVYKCQPELEWYSLLPFWGTMAI